MMRAVKGLTGRTGRSIAIAAFAVAGLIGVAALSRGSEGPALSGSMQEFKPAQTGTPAPSVVFTDRAGQEVSLADLKGKIVVLNVWATWCPPCVKEMPSLEALAKTLDPASVALLAVSEDVQGAAVVDPFATANKLQTLAIDLDPKNTLLRAFHLRGLPTTLILDAEGQELGRLEGGADWSTPEARALIEHYAKKGPEKSEPAIDKA